MAIGFEADDAEPSQQVGGGQHSCDSCDSTEADVKLFVDLVQTMREFGATEVRLGSMRAVFPASTPAAPVVVRAPATPRQTPQQSAAEHKLFEGDSDEDIQRRQGFSELAALVAGS